MADDESQYMTGATRRTPRFSWNSQYEATFFKSLCDSMQLGFKDTHSFKATAWERAAAALQAKHGAYPEKSHLINKADNARKKFRMWRGLREDPEFLYNPTTRMVTASEEAWNRQFERESLSRSLRGRPFEHEEYMEILFPDVIGSGGAPRRVMKKRKTIDGGFSTIQDEGPGLSANGEDPHSIADMPDMGAMSFTQTQDETQNQTLPHNPSQQISYPESSLATLATATSQPATALPSILALTPPDENTSDVTSVRKRPHLERGSEPRRRGRPSRFSAGFYNRAHLNGSITSCAPALTASSFSTNPSRNPTGIANVGLNANFNSHDGALGFLAQEGILALAEALKARNPSKWPEQAMEILFRDFSEEDPDLQLKIAEKALTDENKAMVFVKSTPELRRHWVGRLRELHSRNLGTMSRAGEDASG